jgi:hypothetical protein
VLIELLADPRRAASLRDAQWHAVVEVGRRAQVLGQLSALMHRAGCTDMAPAAVRRHLELAALTARQRRLAALWEVNAIRRAVDPDIPLTLLKGCAYAAGGDVNGEGRLFSDVDLLVPRAQLAATESALFGAGWKPGRVNDYDAAYYRDWMHEVPPMEHVRRHTVVDLHHAINPPVSRCHVNPGPLMASRVEVQPGVYVLCAADRVVHCCLHLLQEGEPKKLLRDLLDLHLLLQQHYPTESSREGLASRAEQLGVGAHVATATAVARGLFQPGGRVPSDWLQRSILRSAREANGATPSVWGVASDTLVLAYSHWMKMPMRLLLPHLLRKSWLRLRPENTGRA